MGEAVNFREEPENSEEGFPSPYDLEPQGNDFEKFRLQFERQALELERQALELDKRESSIEKRERNLEQERFLARGRFEQTFDTVARSYLGLIMVLLASLTGTTAVFDAWYDIAQHASFRELAVAATGFATVALGLSKRKSSTPSEGE